MISRRGVWALWGVAPEVSHHDLWLKYGAALD